jgi:transcription elongation factor Elf1
MREQIRCCPFCGNHAVDICRTNKEACWVQCPNCHAQTDCHKSRSGAIKNWNRRHFDDIPATIAIDDEQKKEGSK